MVFKNFLTMENEKTKVEINKPIYVGFLILEVSKIVMYEFWCDYINSKHGVKAKWCYASTDGFIIHIKTKDCYKDIAPNFEKRFDTSPYIDDRPLLMGNNKKVLRKFKDEIKIGVMTRFVGLRLRTYSLLIDDFEEKKKTKEQRSV